ncbi:MAG: hypothetical protein EHM19_05365 [Candidatus Latescibacterota bacterium]|nr:MAG: hypothetical protein EHM19_05365 [Candidatus Latescibacterota bacterium]
MIDSRGGAEVPQSEGAFSPEGVDLTLIRWMLSLTPAERLRVLQNNVRSILRLRDFARRA